jgi:segregation and condensation protein A
MTDINQDHPQNLLAFVPIATVNGEAMIDLPKDLYIPPDAMKVFLEAFEGPLDLLLYLIRKQNLDILNIPIAEVTRQYVEYIDLMKDLSLDLAAEYLVMAALLAEIKSRMLLPRPENPLDNEEDPRQELIRRLQEYERYKDASLKLDMLPRDERDTFTASAFPLVTEQEKPVPQIVLPDLLSALMSVLKQAEMNTKHLVKGETISVRDKMTYILSSLSDQDHFPFTGLFKLNEGRLGIVVTFLAMLELLKESLIEFVQAAPFAPIYVKPKAA